MKDPAGKPAPKGGFQNGGWYSGYQYWNGSFASQAGVGHNPNQTDIYQKPVSEEVNRQTSIAAGKAPDANQNYINQQNAKPSQVPGASTYSSLMPGGGGGSSMGAGLGIQQPASAGVFDLQKVYDTAKNNPELLALKGEYDTKMKQLNEAEAKINDNPFFSEATRTGRIAKLREAADKEFQRLQGSISTLEGDANTRMDIALKQYDINSQEYQKNLSYLNTLISTGAIAGANDEDLASLGQMTGINPTMLKSIVSKANKGEPPQIVTSVGDDGTLNIIAIDPSTGNVISSNKVAGAGKATQEKESGGSSDFTATQSRALVGVARKALAKVDADTNEDKLLSLAEYQRAVQILMNEQGIDFGMADNILSQEFSNMGYKKWKW